MDLIQQVRLAIYEMTVADGRVPSSRDVAAARHLDSGEVRDAYRALADAHVIVLKPGSTDVWSAPPFSAVETPFRVAVAPDDATITTSKRWYAPCAWDAFGIAAVVQQNVAFVTRCPESGELVHGGVRDGNALGSGVIHLEVPARRFWDDIFYT
jgi:DNA-binding transcriptional MocR family regulator